jgi:arabinofuranosyltransferase
MRTNEKLQLIIIILLAEIVLFFGWRMFLFLTDDEYISFRYVSNSILGYGYLWNPPPFSRVEGYSNFLWIVLLDVI